MWNSLDSSVSAPFESHLGLDQWSPKWSLCIFKTLKMSVVHLLGHTAFYAYVLYVANFMTEYNAL